MSAPFADSTAQLYAGIAPAAPLRLILGQAPGPFDNPAWNDSGGIGYSKDGLTDAQDHPARP
ncbi:MAG: hypothetical protein CMF73_00905 [Maricaulis sp.]|nr:hypothetical protein [Maricaulis sp.]